MEEIIQEKISADHLLYVSLKYTKTCDVIMNLLLRWRKMIDTSINAILESAKRKGKIKEIEQSPIGKITQIKTLFKKDKEFVKVIDFQMMLKKLETLKTDRVGEFRKNVALKIMFRGKEIIINLEQLKIYAEMLEKFISTTKQFLLSNK
ncbi:hypothetical protein HOD29_04685 [archaeon]|jgi:hypothetical protein|nr:hypothetical protein [archaeon]